jgi:hypothetical protein
MTPEERAWCERVHALAMDVVGYCGAAERNCERDSKAARLARKGSLAAVALATEASARIRDAEMKADQAGPDAFDLAALGALPMDGPEVGE